MEDLRAIGVSPVYLLTNQTGFYERYRWELLCMVLIQVYPMFGESAECDYLHVKDLLLEMKPLIAICGLDCEKCDAYLATKNDDRSLREKTAKLWSELNNAPILPEHINCDGCRMDGRKTVFCDHLCQIRQCALGKGFKTCGDCPEKDTCAKVGAIWQHNPQAKINLEG